MPAIESLDAVIIGTGQGGKPLAQALAGEGWRTAIVERGRVGGTCVVRGCTPTKTMIASARVAYLARRAADYGVRTGPVSVDLRRVRERKREIVEAWSDGNRRGLEDQEGLELVRGEGRFASPTEIVVRQDGEDVRRLEADHVFVDVGARPRMPAVPGLSEVATLDSTSIMELGEVPEHLVILGGGLVGLEFGQMFRRFGSRVTLLQKASRIVPREDEDVAEALTEILREDGIDIRTSVEVDAVESAAGGGVRLHLDGDDGPEVVGSHLLVAVGRTPNSDSLNLEAAGLETDDDGHIPVDDACRTAVDGIWALGDVTGPPPFTHTSYDDFRVIRSHLLGDGSRTTRDRVLAYAVFTDPQLGRVGLTEGEARERGLPVRVARLPMSEVARAQEVDETRGFMKAVVHSGTERILGAAVLGLEGGEVATVLQVAMKGDLPYTALRDAALPHPTLAESLNNLFMALD